MVALEGTDEEVEQWLAADTIELGVVLDQLAGQPFVLATGGCEVNARSHVMQEGLMLSDIRVTVRDLGSAAVLVREGLGVSIIPESALPEDRRGLRVMQLEPRRYREFGLVSSQAGRASAAVQTFLDGLSR